MAIVKVESTHDLQQLVTARNHALLADEPLEAGGDDAGPTPYEFLLAALGACTSMTLQLYARRKALPLEKVVVELEENRIYAQDCADCETRDGHITEIRRRIRLEGRLSPEQRQRLMEIAAKCPVHRTLTAEIKIRDEQV